MTVPAVRPTMAAPDLHHLLVAQDQNPAEQLRNELLRLRGMGFEFDLAWKRAMRSITWPVTKETRRQWKFSLEACRDYWGTCYRNEGVRISLGMIIEAMDKGADEPGSESL
jgi:hypothetical protein